MDRRFLILHGIENHRPPEHWQYWLAERLRGRGEQVLYPQLPDADDPRYATWADLVRAELRMLGTGERVVLCHSLACSLWLRLAPELGPEERVTRLLFASPPADGVIADVAPSFAGPPQPAVSASERMTVVCSDADPYNPDGGQPALAAALDADLHVIPGGGHLTPDDGYGPWPGLEAWCLDPAVAPA